jgi:hypothetical protein
MANKILKYGRDATGMTNSEDPMKGPLRNSETGNPSFKGIVRNMEVYHSRSDRTWYTIQMELTDYGLIGEEAINLTSNLEENALDALRKSLEERDTEEIINSNDCKEILNKGEKQPEVLLGLPRRGVTNVDKVALVVDKGTGYIALAFRQNGEWNYQQVYTNPLEGLRVLIDADMGIIGSATRGIHRGKINAIHKYTLNYLDITYLNDSESDWESAITDTNKSNYQYYQEDNVPLAKHIPTGLGVNTANGDRKTPTEVIKVITSILNINNLVDIEDFLLNNPGLEIKPKGTSTNITKECGGKTNKNMDKADSNESSVNESNDPPKNSNLSNSDTLSSRQVIPITGNPTNP